MNEETMLSSVQLGCKTLSRKRKKHPKLFKSTDTSSLKVMNEETMPSSVQLGCKKLSHKQKKHPNIFMSTGVMSLKIMNNLIKPCSVRLEYLSRPVIHRPTDNPNNNDILVKNKNKEQNKDKVKETPPTYEVDVFELNIDASDKDECSKDFIDYPNDNDKYSKNKGENKDIGRKRSEACEVDIFESSSGASLMNVMRNDIKQCYVRLERLKQSQIYKPSAEPSSYGLSTCGGIDYWVDQWLDSVNNNLNEIIWPRVLVELMDSDSEEDDCSRSVSRIFRLDCI